MKHYLVTFDTQFHLNTLLALKETGATDLILIRTPTSVNSKWFEKGKTAFEGISRLELALDSDEPLQIIENFIKIKDYFLQSEIIEHEISICLGAGHPGHNISLWKVFEDLSLKFTESVFCIYTDQQAKRFTRCAV